MKREAPFSLDRRREKARKRRKKRGKSANLGAEPTGPLDASRRKFIMNVIIGENELSVAAFVGL